MRLLTLVVITSIIARGTGFHLCLEASERRLRGPRLLRRGHHDQDSQGQRTRPSRPRLVEYPFHLFFPRVLRPQPPPLSPLPCLDPRSRGRRRRLPHEPPPR